MRDKLEQLLFGKARDKGRGEQGQADGERKEPDGANKTLAMTEPMVDAGVVKSDPQPLPETDELQPVAPPEKSEKAPPVAEPRLEVASRCHIGAVRERNEDACYTFVSNSGGDDPLPQMGAFIVADGMGGHYGGHTASKRVSRLVAQHILDNVYGPLLQESSEGPQQPVQEVLEEAVAQANASIASDDPEKVMGSTLTAALILAGRLFLVHVGDSRAYLLEGGELAAITQDHSVVQALQDSGQISAAEAAVHPNRSVLYRALMGEELEEVDTFTRALRGRVQLLVCSDGLWGFVPQSQIAATLNQEVSVQQKADQLLQAALDAGGKDNITVIVVDFVA